MRNDPHLAKMLSARGGRSELRSDAIPGVGKILARRHGDFGHYLAAA